MISTLNRQPESQAWTGSTAWRLLITALFLVPSAWFLLQFSDLPRLGQFHDDSLYLVSAKSLAAGEGYRIPSLPAGPAQTKYPPLYPLLLSIAWRIAPDFPANLPIAAWLSWLALPAILFQLPYLAASWGLDRTRTLALMALFSLNPYVIFFSTQLLSELWFLAFSIGAMLLIERALKLQSIYWMATAGAIAGLAYLTRSAGIALFAGGIAYAWLRDQRRLAGIFALSISPFFLGWMVWARTHQLPTTDPELIYYLDYFRYEFYAISWSDLPVVLWKNLDGLLAGVGGLLLPRVTGSLWEKILAQVLAAAIISGVVRLLRRGSGWLFGLFALFNVLLLVVWHFPANERLLLPLFPLALAGLILEGEHFVSLLRACQKHKDRSQRIVAWAMMGVASILVLSVLGLQGYVGGIFLPEDSRQHRADMRERSESYRWVVANAPPDAAILSADDALFYLHTGRHSMRRPIPPFLWYREDHSGIVEWVGDPADYARSHGLSYFEFTGVDVSLGVDDEDSKAIVEKIKTNPGFEPLLQKGKTTLYAIRPAAPSVAAQHTAPPPTAR